MYHKIPKIGHAAIYARSDMQQLTREILRMEGIKTVEEMAYSF